MSLAGRLRASLNSSLEPLGFRIQSLTAERAEAARLQNLAGSGHFEREVFPVLASFRECDPSPVLSGVRDLACSLKRFVDSTVAGEFTFANDYFNSPDAEVGYALVRMLRPKKIVEVGSGFSTRLFRSAITDGHLDTELVSIDPSPRREIFGVADRILPKRLEEVDESELVEALGSRSVLFIDSSHGIRAGNDVVTLLLRIVPKLPIGTVIHLHDIFLPFEYPREWLLDYGWDWNEQYLVQGMLQFSETLEVIWAGHYFQRNITDFQSHFVAPIPGRASSLWLRKVR